MSSLKELRSRRKSVQSTKKITAAMKLIAAAKLRYAQSRIQSSRHYAEALAGMMQGLLQAKEFLSASRPLLSGRENPVTHLYIIATSDRGLCGGFNSSIVRRALKLMNDSKNRGQKIKVIVIGRRGYDQIKRSYESSIVERHPAYGKPLYRDATTISANLIKMFNDLVFDECTIVYNQFISALSQKVTHKQLIPIVRSPLTNVQDIMLSAALEFEPSEEDVLDALIPKNLSVQIFNVLLENAASEQGARMTAMDSATRNAEDMIKNLDLTYNRTRQSYITKELIEIISGAEAL
ncbi:MAG: F0F1 ATP synthase subunit gamma [Caedimonadaceae bacterium]|nr:MAG: F0F1 ATP synthase subunit gamma [Caedimonadaceae bacterium]